MKLENVPLESIDLSDETFRISESLEHPFLEQSLARFGQLQPVMLSSKSLERYRVISGFRRVHALNRLGSSAAWGRIWPDDGTGSLEALRLALWDNLSHRELESLEKARVLYALHHTFGVPRDALVAEYLPLLGIRSHKTELRRYLALQSIEPALRTHYRTGRITLATVGRLALAPRELQARYSELLDRVQWSSSRQRLILDLIEELAAIGGVPGWALLESGEIAEVCANARLSAFQRGERVFELLYQKRFPSVARAREQFSRGLKALSLPGPIRISASPFFENPSLRVEFEAESASHFRTMLEALRHAGGRPDFEALFEIGSASEVQGSD